MKRQPYNFHKRIIQQICLFQDLDEKIDTTLMFVRWVWSLNREAFSLAEHSDWKQVTALSLALSIIHICYITTLLYLIPLQNHNLSFYKQIYSNVFIN